MGLCKLLDVYACIHACGIILCMNTLLKYEKVQHLFVLKYFIPCQRCRHDTVGMTH